MGSFSIMHWAILLVVIVLVFGTAKLKNAGKTWAVRSKALKMPLKMKMPSTSIRPVYLSMTMSILTYQKALHKIAITYKKAG